MRIAKNDIPVRIDAPGAVARQLPDFGDASGLGRDDHEMPWTTDEAHDYRRTDRIVLDRFVVETEGRLRLDKLAKWQELITSTQ